MLIALTRQVSSSINNCELTHFTRKPIDISLARAQHHDYVQSLLAAGCIVIDLPEEPTMPDAVFVEDTVLVLDEIAILTRPGAVSRRVETPTVAKAIAPYREVKTIYSPGILDGGDILRLDKSLFVGIGSRSNLEAIHQIEKSVCDFGYRVICVPVSGCLHLKSAVTQVDKTRLLMNPEWVDPELFTGYEIIPVAADEPYAANAIYVNGKVIYPVSFPKTLENLRARSIYPEIIDVSELQKAEGALTCCSVIFTT